MTKKQIRQGRDLETDYGSILGDISSVIDAARRSAARSVNSIMTAAYWLIGRRIVEFEQSGEKRAGYGEKLLERLADDLTTRFGRGFSYPNLNKFRQFYLAYPQENILSTVSIESSSPILSTLSIESNQQNHQTLSEKSQALPGLHRSEVILQTLSEESRSSTAEVVLHYAAACFPLPWSAYVRLLSVKNENARPFYETEALRGGWSVRQLNRQINSQFYERTALSRNKAAMLSKGQEAQAEDVVRPEEEIKDPYVLEFLALKDEYSESDLEEALIRHLETFLLELGGDFCFIGRQKRLRIGDEWYRVDLVFFHRRLRCLVIIDLKIGKFTHADAGQMHLYLNYAREQWVREGENPPVGLILCAQKNEAVARYALEGLPNKVMASEYRTVLPDEKQLATEIQRTQAILHARNSTALPSVGEGGSKKHAKKELSTTCEEGEQT
ncbi:MAG TPA: PDDEXK nuclease domain-containing protein [bacterium]|nr:PDDEXK nuclease domain-containing protein [bacterium]